MPVIKTDKEIERALKILETTFTKAMNSGNRDVMITSISSASVLRWITGTSGLVDGAGFQEMIEQCNKFDAAKFN